MGEQTSRENLVQKALGRSARVLWTDNRSVYLSVRPAAAGARATPIVRLHRSFQSAPDDVWASLTRYLSTGKRRALGAARSYFEAWLGQPAGEAGAARAPRRRVLRPIGKHHDLGEILGEISGTGLFLGLPRVDVTWGARRVAGARSVRLGTYQTPRTPDRVGLIRVHSVLDRSGVPRCVVEHVVHHELVHHLLACTRSAEAYRRHGAEFHRFERLFAGHREAAEWIRQELPGVLRQARRCR
jgi:hypothetical protein